MTTAEAQPTIRSLVPARIDRMPWSSFHTRMVTALGTVWVLDGLEITVASAVAEKLTQPNTLALTSVQVTLLATVYLLGEVAGALYFGRLSDRLGRRKLFMITLVVYMIGSGLTAVTLNNSGPWLIFLYLTRFIAGMGIGGEYAAVNSAIDELIPARYRGRVDLLVNGTYWFGAILGTISTYIFLQLLDPGIGWRIGFAIGPVLALAVLYVRRHLPESPRWQVMHGHEHDAEETVDYIESQVEATGAVLPPVDENKTIEIRAGDDHGWFALIGVLFRTYPTRSILSASMMISQSFLYNAIFFTYTIVLGKFYGVDANDTPLYLIAFAVGNFIGPLVLGPFFDSWGRKQMISLTYITSGILLGISAFLFNAGALTAITQTIAWCIVFFFASAGASSAYLTVSEIFPMEVRAKAIGVFFAIAQCFGALGPVVYGALIGDGSDPYALFLGYLLGAGIMIAGGIVALLFGVAAERQSLEDVAPPLNSVPRTGTTRAEGAGSPSQF